VIYKGITQMLQRLNWSLVSAIIVALAGGTMGAVLVGMANVALAVLGAAGGIGLGAYTGAILGGLVFGDEEVDDTDVEGFEAQVNDLTPPSHRGEQAA